MIKKHFIPHKHNNYRPQILERKAIFILLKAILVIEILFLFQMLIVVPYTDFFSSILPDVLVDLTNNDRKDFEVPLLETNPLLEQAAQLKANDMAEKGYFAHTSPDGKTPWEWLKDVSYPFLAAGENLAVNFLDSNDIENAWMNSPGHRKNILNNRFTEIGIATAKGMYKGRETTFVVQFFGRPSQSVAQEAFAPVVVVSPPKSEPIQVAGAEAEQDTEMFVTTEEMDMVVISPAENMAGVSAVTPKSSFLERLFTMPKEVVNAVYIFIAALILLVVLLKIFVKIKIQHPKLIFNGVIVLFVIISILYFNTLIIEQGIVF